VDAHTFTKRAEKVEANVVCQRADGSCFLGQESGADGRINATRGHNNFRNVLRKTRKTA
jgi:hypothetical protein